MVIGFGSTEIESTRKIMREVGESIIANGKTGHVPVRFKYKKAAEAEGDKPRGQAKGRYSYFFCNVWERYPGQCVAELTIHHINRDHALSPDGWGLLVQEAVVIVSEDHNEKPHWTGFVESNRD